MTSIDERSQHPERKMDVVAEALAYAKKADELRAAAIQELLNRRESIDLDLQTLGYSFTNGNDRITKPLAQTEQTDTGDVAPKQRARFKNMTVSKIARVLLLEHGELHGKRIEELAFEGGFKSGNRKNFQNYMPTALKRAGGFENIGKNTWRLNEEIQPERD